MGYIRHHAIIVTCGYFAKEDNFKHLYKMAKQLFEEHCSDLIPSQMNGYTTFIIAPDGSKEGWETSENYDWKREEFIKILEQYRYSDGSGPLKWVEVQYGDDDGITKIVHHSDEAFRCVNRENEQ